MPKYSILIISHFFFLLVFTPNNVLAIAACNRVGDFPTIPGIEWMLLLLSGFAPPLDQLLREKAELTANNNLSFDEATKAIYESLNQAPEHFLYQSQFASKIPLFFCSAFGQRQNQLTKSSVWLSQELPRKGNFPYLTASNLACGILTILRGEIKERGVFKAEEIYEFDSYMKELTPLIPEIPSSGRIFEQRLESFS